MTTATFGDLYDEALKLADVASHKAAAEKLKEFIAANPKDKRVNDARLKQAEAFLAMGRIMDASTVYEEVLKSSPTEEQERSTRLLTPKCLEARGEFVRAISKYKEFIGKYRDKPEARDLVHSTWLYVARLYRHTLNSYKAAEKELTMLLVRFEKHQGNAAVLWELAELYRHNLRNIRRAQEVYTLLYTEFPKSRQAQKATVNSAYLLEEGGIRDWPKAIVEYQTYLKAFPQAEDRYERLVRVAWLYRDRLRQYQNAIDHYDLAFKVKPNPGLLWERAIAVDRSGKADARTASYKGLMQKFPGTKQAVDAWRSLARLQWDTKQYAESIRTLETMLKKHSSNAGDWWDLANRLRSHKQWDRAAATYDHIIATWPTWNPHDLYVYKSWAYLNRYDDAVARKATAEADKALQDAIAALQPVFEKWKGHTNPTVRALWHLAYEIHHKRSKKVDEAIASFEKIIDSYRNYQHWANKDHSIRYLCENHLAKSKSLDGAAQFVSGVLAKDPYSENMRYGIASIMARYNASKEYQKAVSLAKGVLDVPHSGYGEAYTLLHLGHAYRGLAAAPGAKNVGALQQSELEAYAQLERYRRNHNYRGIHREIDQVRKQVIAPLLRAQSIDAVTISEMSLKQDAEGESDDSWATAPLNDWKPTPLGKDWGKFDGIGWYAAEVGATPAQGEYVARFRNVDDEMWLYADGKLVGSHAGAGKAFAIRFEAEKTEGKIRLAVKVKDNGGTGGILGKVVVERPKPVGKQEALNIALARQALKKHADAVKDYHDWMKGMTEKDPQRDIAIRFQNQIYALDGNLERLQANKPLKPTAEYYRLLGSLYESKKQYDKAAVALQQATKAEAGNLSASQSAALALAKFYERRSDWRAAHNAYLALIEIMKDTPAEGRFKGHLVYITNDRWRNYGRARELITDYAGQYAQSGYWTRRLADHLYDYSPQNYAAAMGSYQKWFMMNNGLDPAHVGSRIWDCLMRAKNYNAAQAFCNMWLGKFGGHPYKSEMLYRQAEIKRALGEENSQQREQALAAFNQLQKDFPRSGTAYNAIRRVMENYSLDEAIAMIGQWEKDNPKHSYTAQLLWDLGQRMEQHKDHGFAKALEVYQRIWKDYRWKWAENLYAYDRIANHLWAKKDYDAAYTIYEQAMRQFGGNRDGRALNAWWRYAQKFGNFVPFKIETESTHEQFKAIRLSDGQTDGQSGHPNNSWASADSDKDHWIDCVMSQPQEVRRIVIWWAGTEHLPLQYKVQYFDGKQYVDLPEMTAFRAAKEVNESHTVKPVKTSKIRILQKASGGQKGRPGVMLAAEVRLYRHVNDELWVGLGDHYRTMMGRFRNQNEHWYAGRSLCSYLAWRGEHLEADVEMQKLLYELPTNHTHFWDLATKEAQQRMDRDRFGESAAIFRTLLTRHKRVTTKRRLDAERLMGQALSKSGEDYAAIDPDLPEAGLLWGSVFARNGENDLAWERYQQNKVLFFDHQHKLSFEFIRLIVRNLLLERETREAIKVCRHFLIKRKDDKHVTSSERAQIQLLIGDAYFREERFEIARDEYNTVLTLPEYKNLFERVEARFKVAQTLMAQKIYAKSEEIFEDLTSHPDEDTMARAHLMLGILYHAKGETKRAEEKFKEVLAMMPNNETADEIIYRLGTVYQERRKYKEALDALRLIGAWSGESKRVVEPGRSLRIRLSDRDLTIARGSPEVPVIVTTSGGDTERALLEKSEVGKGLFVAEVETELGEPAQNDRKLQIMGDDTITYAYDPEWAADFKIIKDEDAPPPIITVAADADLKASSTEIKEEEELEVDPNIFSKDEPKRSGFRLFRDDAQLKPGNLVYVRVKDYDRDVSNDPDEVEIIADATSGDSVTLKMTETEPHTGIFVGEVKTGHRPPDATASDSMEGHEARHAIDGKKDAQNAWIGALDNRPPKWIAVDLKEVIPVSRFEWNRGEGYDPKEDRAPLRYLLEGSKDKKTWFPMAFEPTNQAPRLRNAIAVWNPDGTRNYRYSAAAMLKGTGNTAERWGGEPKRADWIVDINLGRVTEIAKTILRNHDAANEVRKYAIYTEKEPGRYPGRIRDLDNWNLAYQSEPLAKPQPDAADFAVPEEPKEGARTEPLRAQYVRLLITEAFGTHPEIGEFEVYPRVQFASQTPEEGIGGTFTFDPPVQTRHIRMTIMEFHNDAPAIAHIAVYDREGKIIVPTGEKIHELATNDTLELSPGDEITVTYLDEKNIHPGEPKPYRATLAATYFNGLVRAIVHDFREDARGNRSKVDYMVRRIRPGDRFIVEIIEYDEDKTDGIDKVPFVVKTASGKNIELEARETEPYSGIFTKEVDTSIDGKAGTLQVADNDSVTIEYLDAENTDPGHKAPRIAAIYTATPTEGKVRVRSNVKTTYVAEKAEEDTETTKLVAIEEDLEVEVVDPDMALNSGNTVTVKLTTTNGAEATVECRIGGAVQRFSGYRQTQSMLSDALELGVFRGSIRVALGDKASPTSRVQVTGFGDSEFAVKSKKKRKKEEGPTVELLNVMGGDIITARYVDETTPENPLATERYDSARIISDGEFGIFDSEYEKPLEFAHVGEKIHLQVTDPDLDRSPERDTVVVKVRSLFDDGTEDVLECQLVETLSHSGIFNGSIGIEHKQQPDPENTALEANFGNEIRAAYLDRYNTESAADPRTLEAKVQVVTGTDGEMVAFGQRFPDDDLAVETQFRIGECYYFLGKHHVELKQSDMGLRELSEGQQMLTELVRHFPESEMVDQIGYLLGNITQEQKKFDDAIVMYRRVTRDYPESVVAADAQYKTAMCYEKKGEFDLACEEYVRLAYKYPESPLVSDSMIRIGLYYFNKKKYDTSLGVFGRFVEKFQEHQSVQKVAFKMGLCFILAERFGEGGDHFKGFVEKFPDSELKPAALYWAGDSYLKANDALKSYQMFKRCIWDFPDSKWAKFARGRLTAPVFDRIAEME